MPIRDLSALLGLIRQGGSPSPTPLRSLRSRVTWGVALGTFCLLALLSLFGSRTLFEPRPLFQAHSMFANRCELCHNQGFSMLRRFARIQSKSPMDSACESCHDGAAHQPVDRLWPNCISCHSEHLGKDSLVRVPDETCLGCHATSIDTSSEPGRSQFDAIRGFGPGLHPHFAVHRLVQKDPSHLIFPHQLHGAPRNEAGKFEKLECAFCHEPDESRRLTKPVNYDRHCARCHALRFELNGEHAPHGDPAMLRNALQKRYYDYLRQDPTVAITVSKAHSAAKQPSLAEADSWINTQTTNAEKSLYSSKKGCPLCHTGIVVHPPELPQLSPSSIPIPWLTHVRYTHDSHRMLACLGCHQKAPFSATSQDILIPPIALCETCHNSQGASKRCVSCHDYHNRRTERTQNGTFLPQQLNSTDRSR